MGSRLLVAAVSLAAAMAMGCTRSGVDKETVRLVIPFNGSNSSLATGDMLKFAAVNIQVPGRPLPIVREFEFHNNPIPWGTPIDLVIPNVPSGSGFLIQFLGVFDTAAGASYLITYGDTLTDIGKGTTQVNIQATAAGTATKEGRVAGRYFTSPTSGPTGDLVAFFYPPNGRPRMALEKTEMVGGWFNIFVLDNIPLTYVLIDSGVTIFGGLTLGSPALASSTSVLHVSTPAYYRREQKNGVTEVRPRVSGNQIVGFFKNANGPSFAAYRVCYPSNHREGTNGMYQQFVGGKLKQPIKFDSVAPTANDVRVNGGGVSVPLADWGTNATCNPASGTDLIYHVHRQRDGDNGPAGLRPPFRLIDPFKLDGGYVRRTYDGTANKIKLEWRYLYGANPGAVSVPISGVEILAKNSSGGGGGDRRRCPDLLNEGYQTVGAITTSAEFYEFNGTASLPLTTSNQWSYQFALCPYHQVDATTRRYVGSVVQSDCSSFNCGALEHFGWGVSSVTISTATSVEDPPLGVAFSRVSGVATVAAETYFTVSVTGGGPPLTAADVGGELMLSIIAENGTGAVCGTFNGQILRPGTTQFTRLLAYDSGALKVPRGTFLEGLDNTHLSASTSSSNFCFVQATRVPHFQNLALLSHIFPANFDHVNGGGMIPFRVSGDLTIAAGVSIVAAGKGHPGGNEAAGAGQRGRPAAPPFDHSGGHYGGSMIGHGGGAGPTADGGDGVDASTLPNGGQGGRASLGSGFGDYVLTFGGGGSGEGAPGGRGGGIVFIAARNMSGGSGTPAYISVDGESKSGYKGGGGAGSILIVGQKVQGFLDFSARGGSAAGGANSGGAGGGGVISTFLCENSATLFSNVAAGTGPLPTGTAGGASDGSIISPDTGQWNPACR